MSGFATSRAKFSSTAEPWAFPPEFDPDLASRARTQEGLLEGRRSAARGISVQITYVLTDVCCVFLNGVLMLLLHSLHWKIGSIDWDLLRGPLAREYFGFFWLYAALVVLCCVGQGLYHTQRDLNVSDEVWKVAKAVAGATALLSLFIFTSANHDVSRLVVGLSAILCVCSLSAWRAIKRDIIRGRSNAGIGLSRVLIVGAGRVGRSLAAWIEANRTLGFQFCGFLDSLPSRDPRVLGDPQDIRNLAIAQFADELFVTLPADRELVKHLVFEAKKLRMHMRIVPDLYDGLAWQAPFAAIGGFPSLQLCGQPIPVAGLAFKRVLDVCVSVVGLIGCFPLLLILALLIKLDSPGSVLYVADRIGRKGKAFRCVKLRTMRADADALKDTLRSINERNGPIFKIQKDPRVTSLGRWLRKLSLDEIPQLVNVLIGDMSLVGPRPHPTDDYERYHIEHLRRLDVKPGLTGLWQATARNNPSFEKSMELDLKYIENWSLWLDFTILIRTVPAVLRANGN